MKEKIIDKINIFIGKLNASVIIRALTSGMVVAMPAIIGGSIATILMNLQIAGYQEFIMATGIHSILNTIVIVTINFTALYTVFGIAYNYTKIKNQDAVPAGILGITSFFILTPLQAVEVVPGYFQYSLPTNWLGAQGVFSAMIIGFMVGAVFSYVKEKGFVIKMPESVPSFIQSSFSAIIPGIVIITIVGALALLFSNTEYGSLHQAIYSILQTPIQNVGGNIWSLLAVIVIGQLLWVFGIHGPMVVMSLAMIAWRPLDLANLTAYNAGEALPNIIGQVFFKFTTYSGAGIGLAVCMMLSKSKRYKTMGKLSIIPAIFGITEPLIFGAPIVMNFTLAIPHVLLPIISALLGYAATLLNILPRMAGIGLPTGIPVILYGFLQGGWRAALFQVFLIVIWVIGFYPFVKRLDKKETKLELEAESLVVEN